MPTGIRFRSAAVVSVTSACLATVGAACLATVGAGSAAASATHAGAGSAVASATHSAPMPRMHFDHRIRVETVCFSVTNPAGSRSILYGLRYTDTHGSVRPSTPAIVLVHGIASSTENWDFSPTWSVARALAAAGYVVYSYDRLGYAKSSYFATPGGGTTLSTAAHRAELHQIVEAVKSGRYTTTVGGSCSAPRRRSTVRSRRVVIMGHSAGGWIVAGYPGEHHDVAAMIQADIDGSGAQPPPGTPLPAPAMGGAVTPDPSHPDYFVFFQTRQDCQEFNTYPPGEVAYVVRIACTPPFIPSPIAEITDIPTMYAENDASIGKIGPSIPVLLTSGDQDTTDPPVLANADYAFYKAHCGCDVTQLRLRDTAHLFMAHQSLPIWVNYVVRWLGTKGLRPARRSPPVRCTQCVVPFVR